jgi:hypothetical protein
MRWLRSERVWLVSAFVLHVAVTLWVSLHHEPWFDEADPWLLMRDATPAKMLHSSANRGVPLLWEMTVLPFARLGFPYLAQQLLNLVYVWGAVLLFLRSRAFSTPVKVLFALSYYPAFEFAVIPRPYGLQMLLTFAMAEAWKTRHERPVRLGVLAALLANTTTMGLVTAAIAGAILLWERVSWKGLGIMVAGGLAAAVQLWPRPEGQKLHMTTRLDTVWFAITSTFFPGYRLEDFVGGALIILVILFYGISRRWAPPLFLGSILTALLCIYVFVWMGGLRHAGVMLVVVLAAVIVADAYGAYRRERLLMAALAVSFAFSIYPAWDSWRLETRAAFSGSVEVADYLRTSGLAANATLVVPTPFYISPLVHLPGVKLWDPLRERSFTFVRWDYEDWALAAVPLEMLVRRTETQMRGRRWVLITHRQLPEAMRGRFRLLFRTKADVWHRVAEKYWIYEPMAAGVERPGRSGPEPD